MPRIAIVCAFLFLLLVSNTQLAHAGRAERNLDFTLSYLSEDVCDTVLGQNTPNPFHSSTDITLCIPKKTSFEVTVFNVLGELIDQFITTESQPGTYQLHLCATQLPPGIYFYRLVIDMHTAEPMLIDTKKMMCVE